MLALRSPELAEGRRRVDSHYTKVYRIIDKSKMRLRILVTSFSQHCSFRESLMEKLRITFEVSDAHSFQLGLNHLMRMKYCSVLKVENLDANGRSIETQKLEPGKPLVLVSEKWPDYPQTAHLQTSTT